MPIMIDSDFIGGAIEDVQFIDSDLISFKAPLDGCERGLWFYFRIRGAQGKTLTFLQKGMDRVLGVFESGTYEKVQPLVKDGKGAEWRRIPKENTKFTVDPLEFRFTVTPAENETFIAFSYPYVLENFESFLKMHATQYIKRETLGKTNEGRDFPFVIVGDEGGSRDKKLLVFVARHHAGEVSGSYVLEGILETALSETAAGKEIRKNYVLAVFPMADLDGVEEGRYGKDRPPVDFNRDWCYKPYHNEIRLMQRKIAELATRYEYVFFADLHSPQPGGASYLLPARKAFMGQSQWEDYYGLVHRFEHRVENIARCRMIDLDPESLNWSQYNYQYNSIIYNAIKYGVLSVSLETSYNLDGNGKLLSPVEWREMGRNLIESVAEQLDLNAAVEAEKYIPGRIYEEILWRDWEPVTIPRSVSIEETIDCISFTADKDDGEAWVTRRVYYEAEKCMGDVKLLFDYNFGEKAQAEIIEYFYKDGDVLGHFVSTNVLLETGSYEWTPYINKKEEVTHCRISIKVKGLKGKLSIKVVDTSLIRKSERNEMIIA